MKKRIGLVLVTTFLVLSSLFSISSEQDNLLTIILVRHAEKVLDDSTDPLLTEKGKARAAELAYILKHVPLDAVFSTPYIRTRETVLPSAKEKGIKLEYYNAGSEKELLMRIFNRYKGKKGFVLIAGHSNTLHLFLNFLVGEDLFVPIEDDIYDNIFFVTASIPGKATVLHLRYGR